MRNPYLDNLKIVLIFLVVLGHCLEYSQIESPLLFLIYVFHVPAFVFLAGITSKANQTVRQVKPLLLIFAAFQIAYTGALMFGKHASLALLIPPYWVLWFLLAIAAWKLMLPLMSKSILWLAASVVFALLAGFVPFIGMPLALSRIFVWLPFFLCGFFYGKPILRLFENCKVWVRLVGAFVVIGSLIGCSYIPVLHAALYESLPYRVSGIGPSFRLEHMIAAAIVMSAFFVVLPRRASWMTAYGQRTLAILVLHPALMIVLRPVLTRMHSGIVAMVAALVVTILCGYPRLELFVRSIGRIGEVRAVECSV